MDAQLVVICLLTAGINLMARWPMARASPACGPGGSPSTAKPKLTWAYVAVRNATLIGREGLDETMKTIPSLKAQDHLPGSMTSCSWQAGWRSVLLRGYDDAPEAEFTTQPTNDHLIVLVVDGECEIDSRYPTRRRRGAHRRGSIDMTAPGEDVLVRWTGQTRHSTLQLHIPEQTIRGVLDDLSERSSQISDMPGVLRFSDPVVAWTILSLSQALSDGAPDLYADSAAHFLTAHLLTRHGQAQPRPTPTRDDLRVRRVDDYIRDNLSASISLEDMAAVAGVSRFHLVRLFSQFHKETPFRRLTRIRMEEARRRLMGSADSVTEIAFACGYENPAHFASAFRRTFGVSPRQYRQGAA